MIYSKALYSAMQWCSKGTLSYKSPQATTDRAVHNFKYIRIKHPGIERNMALSDQTLVCRDCNQEFVFTIGEQEFYESHRLTNTPSRCPSCRAARKASGGFGGGSRAPREARQMYSTTCSSCGNEAQVPFQPRGDKPVYCSDCYQSQSAGNSNDRRSRW
jgi:CxxC-x17-CxxC domain-containing protein